MTVAVCDLCGYENENPQVTRWVCLGCRGPLGSECCGGRALDPNPFLADPSPVGHVAPAGSVGVTD